jgi:hypothetical protein
MRHCQFLLMLPRLYPRLPLRPEFRHRMSTKTKLSQVIVQTCQKRKELHPTAQIGPALIWVAAFDC